MKLELVGCTPAKINQFVSRNIHSCEDLVKLMPRNYNDFRMPKMVSEVVDGQMCSIVIIITSSRTASMGNGGKVVNITGRDERGGTLNVVFFNAEYVSGKLYEGVKVILCGKVNIKTGDKYGGVFMSNPAHFSTNIMELQKILPIYKKIPKMSELYFNTCMEKSLNLVDKRDSIEPEIVNRFKLLPYCDAIVQIHMPNTLEDIEKAKHRFLFDDLFYFNFSLKEQSLTEAKDSNISFHNFPTVISYMNNLPFKLTQDQRQALRTLSQDANKGERINTLLQGDVGCGKTEVAKLMMLTAYDSGYQSVIMAPTNVLARQHYDDICKSFEPYGIKIAYISGDIKKSEKKIILKGLADGDISMVVGTHAVINKEIEYKNLGITIVDEEHRFGVAQREALKSKASEGIHSLSMTATPIPRSLAISLFGDSIKVITIKNKPIGRKDIITKRMDDDSEIYNFILKELKDGHQAYVVCPLIDESESERMDGVSSVEDTYKKMSNFFSGHGFKVGVTTGKMKPNEVADVINKFTKNEYQLLVSTTIIEVGINVPNASVICIKSAERFGLAQLHQLRGRVGRGSDQGYCLLQNGIDTELSNIKLGVMCESNDGFVIAKKDLEIRGTGDFIGTSQSGDNKYVMLMMDNLELNREIKELINEIFMIPEKTYRYRILIDEMSKQ